MKGERRHQLQHNELSDALGAGLERAYPYLKWGVLAVLAAMLMLLVSWYLRGQRAQQSSRAAGEFLFASALDDAESFRVVSTDYPDAPGGLWATLAQGDVNLAEALQLFYSDREQAGSFLTAAETAYRSVIERAKQPMLLSRAHLGLAKTLETNNKLKEAAEQYQLAGDKAESDELRQYCNERATLLEQPRMNEFYSWLEQLPTISATPPSLPETNLGSLPDQPDTSLPPLAPNASGGASTTPVETTPVETAPVETTPVETTPVETTPVETTPVETTPVETTPVETTPVETTPVETAPVETTPVETPAEGDGVTPAEPAASDEPPATPPGEG
jgi:hypothetical protein